MSILDKVKGLREAVDPASIEVITLMEARMNLGDKNGIQENIFGVLRTDTRLRDSVYRADFLRQVGKYYFDNSGC